MAKSVLATALALCAACTLPWQVAGIAKISEQSLLLPYRSGPHSLQYSLSASREEWAWQSTNTSVISVSTPAPGGKSSEVNVSVIADTKQRAFAMVEARRGGAWRRRRLASVLNGAWCEHAPPAPARTPRPAQCTSCRATSTSACCTA